MVIAERIRAAGQVAWAMVGLAALTAIVLAVLWTVRVVFPPLILAGALVFVLNPVVDRLQARGMPRVFAVTAAFLGVAVVMAAVVALVTPLVRDQADHLSDEWPEIEADLEAWVDDLSARSQDWPITIPQYDEIVDELASEDGEETSLADTLDQVRDIGGRVLHAVLIVVLTPILAVYILVDLPRLTRVVTDLVPTASREEVLHIGRRLGRAMGGFFRGQLLVALIVGVMVSIGLAVIGLESWLLVGMVAGLFNVIPLVGPWVGGVPAVAIALTTQDPGTAIIAALIMVGAQQVDNHLISPLVMQRAVKLHPAFVLLALLAGGTLGGFFGLLLAVPTAAVVKIVLGHLWHTYVLGEPWEVAVSRELASEDSGGPVKDVVDLDN